MARIAGPLVQTNGLGCALVSVMAISDRCLQVLGAGERTALQPSGSAREAGQRTTAALHRSPAWTTPALESWNREADQLVGGPMPPGGRDTALPKRARLDRRATLHSTARRKANCQSLESSTLARGEVPCRRLATSCPKRDPAFRSACKQASVPGRR